MVLEKTRYLLILLTMSIYYNQTLVDPSPVYAEVKELLSSYFNAGVANDMLFPRWTQHCLAHIGKAQFEIKETVLDIEGYEACVPKDFKYVRELWACSVTFSAPVPEPGTCYYQTDCRIEPIVDSCNPCFGPRQDCIMDYKVMHKVKNWHVYSFRRSHLLRPGNMNAKNCCHEGCANLHSQSYDTFDIVNNKIITNVSSGKLHLTYYAYDEDNILIPEYFWVQDYIRKYLIYMCFYQISNQVTDETYNQVQQKLAQAQQDMANARATAMTELKKYTTEETARRIRSQYVKFNNRYRL